MIRDKDDLLKEWDRPGSKKRRLQFEVAIDLRDALLDIEVDLDNAAKKIPQPEVVTKEPIEVRRARFIATALPGAIFVNEYGSRRQIIREEPDYVVNINDDPEAGPWYRVKVLWSDHDPTEEINIWHWIGVLENPT